MADYKVNSLDLVEKVHNMIKLLILKNQLVPGQKLVQEDLAEKLGVSRTPLLAALSKLEKEFLVESRPRRGYYIRKLTREEKLNLFDIRLRLEPLTARQAAGRITLKQGRELLKKAELTPGQLSAMDHQAFCEYDFEFHRSIQELSGNEFLYKMISSYNLISLSNQAPMKDFEPSMTCHRELAEVIADRRQEEAEKIMYSHISMGRDRVLKGDN
jgi:DNA-binding GntR family transcriptional regulator